MLKKYLTNIGPLPIYKNKKIKHKLHIGKKFNIVSFGNKNPNKIFYIIRRDPGAGLFSNVTVVLNHIMICKKFNFIPVVDMENFSTIYNEKSKILGTFNAWEYYFEKINKYNLSEVYKSRNVIISNSEIEHFMIKDMTKKKIRESFRYIKIKKKYFQKAENFYQKKVNRKNKVLGIHFRGSTYKVARGHAFPFNVKIMIKTIYSLINKYKYDKILLVTEEKKYLNVIKKEFGDKCIYYNSFRMNKQDLFRIYPRKLHRYRLGEEILVETILLSKCDGLAYIKSNVISAAILISNVKQKYHEFFLGYNSKNKFISRWLWYFKTILPSYLGGLKIKKFKFNI